MFSLTGRRDEEVLLNIVNNSQWHGAVTKRQAVELYISGRQNVQENFAIYAQDSIEKNYFRTILV